MCLIVKTKQKIMIFKINSKHNDNYILTTTLFTNDLQLTSKSAISIPMPAKGRFSYRILA